MGSKEDGKQPLRTSGSLGVVYIRGQHQGAARDSGDSMRSALGAAGTVSRVGAGGPQSAVCVKLCMKARALRLRWRPRSRRE